MNLPRIEISELPALKAKNFTDEEFANYLSEKRIVIVDASSYITQTLQRLLIQLGATSSQIFVYRTYATAALGIRARRPHVLITALRVESDFGLELVKLQEEQFSNRLEIASLVVVPDTSSTSAGLIAEANVDAVLMKPLNAQSTKDALFQAFANKVKPSPYWSALEKGKEHLNRVELEQAMRLFEEAKSFDAKPTLSFYYQGLVQQRKKEFELALDCFDGGLYYDPRDYRCLNASFDLRMARAEYFEAYSLVQKIHEVYPVNTRRLLDLVKLSISVGKFEDIPDYHQVFLNSENVDPSITRGMIAALLVAAKSFSWRDDRVRSLEVLRSASRMALKYAMLREDALRYFIETRHFEYGLAYYSDLPATLKEEMSLQLLNLEAHHGLENSSEAIALGNQLLKSGKPPARAYEIVIENSRKLGRPDTVIGRLVSEAREYYPTQKW